MKFKSIQFHAEPRELILNALELAHEFNLLCVSCEVRNQRVVDLRKELDLGTLKVSEEFRYLIVLLERNLDEVVTLFSDFLSIKKEGVYIEVGALGVNGLMESSISFCKDEIQYINTSPDEILKRFKKSTKTGAISFNVNTGFESVSRSHRYTMGAKALYDSGVKILPFGGGKTVFFKLQ